MPLMLFLDIMTPLYMLHSISRGNSMIGVLYGPLRFLSKLSTLTCAIRVPS